MNKEELEKYLKAAPDTELEENIAAGPSPHGFRFAASISEKDSRRRAFEESLKRPGAMAYANLIFTVLGSVAAMVAAILTWLSFHPKEFAPAPVAEPVPATGVTKPPQAQKPTLQE